MNLAEVDEVPELLDEKEAAELLRTEVSVLRFWRRPGQQGPAYVKVGGKVCYRREDLAAWVESRVVRPALTLLPGGRVEYSDTASTPADTVTVFSVSAADMAALLAGNRVSS